MKLLFKYIMYHLWEWRHRRKTKITSDEAILMGELDNLKEIEEALLETHYKKRSEIDNILLFLSANSGFEISHLPERLADKVTIRLHATMQKVPDFKNSTLIASEDWTDHNRRRFIMDTVLMEAAEDLRDKGFKPDFTMGKM